MTPDQERWAAALAIERIYGADAPRWITERMAALMLAGDGAGVQRFRDIATRFDQLRQEVPDDADRPFNP